MSAKFYITYYILYGKSAHIHVMFCNCLCCVSLDTLENHMQGELLGDG